LEFATQSKAKFEALEEQACFGEAPSNFVLIKASNGGGAGYDGIANP